MIGLADKLPVVIPDYTVPLVVVPQTEIGITREHNQVIHTGDDDSDEVVILSASPATHIEIQYNVLEDLDAEKVWDYYDDAGKGNGFARTFPFPCPRTDAVYVVSFVLPVTPRIRPVMGSIGTIKLRVHGKMS